MPGFMEVSTSDAQSGPYTQVHENDSAPQSPIKDELDGDDVLVDPDSDDHNPTVYKPRPQLPPPNVNMRSLKSLISKEDYNDTCRGLC